MNRVFFLPITDAPMLKCLQMFAKITLQLELCIDSCVPHRPRPVLLNATAPLVNLLCFNPGTFQCVRILHVWN